MQHVAGNIIGVCDAGQHPDISACPPLPVGFDVEGGLVPIPEFLGQAAVIVFCQKLRPLHRIGGQVVHQHLTVIDENLLAVQQHLVHLFPRIGDIAALGNLHAGNLAYQLACRLLRAVFEIVGAEFHRVPSHTYAVETAFDRHLLQGYDVLLKIKGEIVPLGIQLLPQLLESDTTDYRPIALFKFRVHFETAVVVGDGVCLGIPSSNICVV